MGERVVQPCTVQTQSRKPREDQGLVKTVPITWEPGVGTGSARSNRGLVPNTLMLCSLGTSRGADHRRVGCRSVRALDLL